MKEVTASLPRVEEVGGTPLLIEQFYPPLQEQWHLLMMQQGLGLKWAKVEGSEVMVTWKNVTTVTNQDIGLRIVQKAN